MMKSGIMFEQGDIVIIPFPFTDLSAVKQRPVLIISNREYNHSAEDIVVCGITSNLEEASFSVMVSNCDLSEGKIPVESRIKVDKLFTLKQSLIIKKVAHIKPDILKKVKEEISLLLK